MFKIMLLGDERVGKSSLFSRYFNGGYVETYTPTIGLYFNLKTIKKTSDSVAGFKIYDTSGKKMYRELVRSHTQEASALIIVFDVTNQKSFNNAKKWLEEAVNEDAITILVATKCDLVEERKVDKETAMNFAKSQEINYYEASAKENVDVAEIFQVVIDDLMFRNFESNANKVIVDENLVNEVIKKLQKYIDRISSYHVRNATDINFKHGFLFFRESRALNRKANYKLAFELKKELEKLGDGFKNTEGIKSLFSDCSIDKKRKSYIKKLPNYVERGVKSSELNGIINGARKLGPNSG